MGRIKGFLGVVLWTTLFAGLVNLSESYPKPSQPECSYESCPKGLPDMLNVHIIPHSHMDLGWLKTKDQYYYGANNSITIAGVQYILDSVVHSLAQDPLQERRFIQVETAFFHDWYRHQPDSIKELVKDLIYEGRLEFIGGGWAMNDEAVCHYSAIIDQMTFGLKELQDVAGQCGIPKVAWQIDPFGHSKEQASLFAEMNYDGLFLGRIDYQDKGGKEQNQTMEFVWKGNEELGESSNLFTGVLPNTYSPPPGFCFDILCKDQPIMDDPDMTEYNVDERVDEFLKVVANESVNYATNHIPVTMGNDFNYQDANTWYKNLDKLIKYVNERQAYGSRVNVFYSTPSCYLYALNRANRTWTTKSDDFFPYASDPHAYWTGFYTSRPTVKYYERVSNNFLQVCKQLHSMAALPETADAHVRRLKDAMGVLQHHDAVTGTERQHVVYDYERRLSNGTAACQEVVNQAYHDLMRSPPLLGKDPPTQYFCNLLNISQCEITERSKPVAVTIYNPLAQPLKYYVRLPVVRKGYKVMSPNLTVIRTQIVPIPKPVFHLPTRTSKATFELVFEADLPALGFATYFVKPTSNAATIRQQMSRVVPPEGMSNDIIIDNGVIAYVFDRESGLVKEVKTGNQALPISQDFYYYKASSGNNSEFQFRASGAYIFRPNGTLPVKIAEKAKITTVVQGRLVQEVHQVFSNWTSQVVRLYRDAPYAEFDWIVGPIPVNDGIGKEVISKFSTTKLKTDKRFYTDANGRQILERIRNHRQTFTLNLTEPVSANYYPVASRIILNDTKSQLMLAVLTDRSQGGSSMQDGAVELMVHRRLLYDDAFGVGEALNETDVNGKGLVVCGRHWVIFDSIKSSRILQRKLGRQLYMAPYLSFAPYSISEPEYVKQYTANFSGLQHALPENVHLLTMEQWSDPHTLLLRFEHYFDAHDDANGNLSNPVTFSIQNLFDAFQIDSVTETTLAGNQPLKDANKRLKWVTTESEYQSVIDYDLTPDKVTLKPMQIKTFIAHISRVIGRSYV